MNAHVTAHLPVEEESPAPSMRVPAETAEPFAERSFRKEGSELGVRLTGEVEEPSLGEGFEEGSGISGPNTGERLPAVARPWWGRLRTLLLGAAVIAFCVAGAAGFLVFPYNHASPFRQMASTLRHWAAEMGIKRTEPLALAASLADVPTEPAEPVIREKYRPKRKDQQLQEVIALQSRAPQDSRGGGKSANEPPAAAAPAPGQGVGADAPPPRLCSERAGDKPGFACCRVPCPAGCRSYRRICLTSGHVTRDSRRRAAARCDRGRSGLVGAGAPAGDILPALPCPSRAGGCCGSGSVADQAQ